jgi:hypothetical protein
MKKPEFEFSIKIHFPQPPMSSLPQQLSGGPMCLERASEAAPTNQIFSPYIGVPYFLGSCGVYPGAAMYLSGFQLILNFF